MAVMTASCSQTVSSHNLRTCVLCLLFASIVGHVAASRGDRHPAFEECTRRCYTTGCTFVFGFAPRCLLTCQAELESNVTVPWELEIMQWDCVHDCWYECMWDVIQTYPELGSEKYFGKWPFVRVLGMQEIVSVMLSLGNLLAHIVGISMFHQAARISHSTKLPQSSQYPFSWLWWLYSLAHMNAWVWSAVFHARDLPFTSRIDYVSADVVVAVSMFVMVCRTLGLSRGYWMGYFGVIIFAALLQHVAYMLLIKFDFGYNMKVCIFCGLVQTMLWLWWAFKVGHSQRKLLAAFFAMVYASLLLEVFDFPPFWSLVDAHACWHAATIPLTVMWYKFLCGDVTFVSDGAFKATNAPEGDQSVGDAHLEKS